MSKALRAKIHCECPHCNFIVELTLYGNDDRFKNSFEAVECYGCNQLFVVKFSAEGECDIFKCDVKKHKARAFCTFTQINLPEVQA